MWHVCKPKWGNWSQIPRNTHRNLQQHCNVPSGHPTTILLHIQHGKLKNQPRYEETCAGSLRLRLESWREFSWFTHYERDLEPPPSVPLPQNPLPLTFQHYSLGYSDDGGKYNSSSESHMGLECCLCEKAALLEQTCESFHPFRGWRCTLGLTVSV